ncbi:hypothetical protein [Endozoicomonas sp. 8E]|uniref:hypothetical protein n=1 Tax=Endozoicomonas sp. 8E TaxID=3035692 RepID=UPI00293901B8|nr:hypothetical protein [Endozoicomonas sp. 8E]WOG26208.1 hypothetical protein P6910_16775 [Endozoicomonas sp. 8E]
MNSTSIIQEIQAKLTLTLKDIYTLALNADEQLEILQKEEKGNFSAIFQKDSGFSASANRFLPYLIELNDEIESLPIMEPENQRAKIEGIMKKMRMMHEVLARFHSIKDETLH